MAACTTRGWLCAPQVDGRTHHMWMASPDHAKSGMRHSARRCHIWMQPDAVSMDDMLAHSRHILRTAGQEGHTQRYMMLDVWAACQRDGMGEEGPLEATSLQNFLLTFLRLAYSWHLACICSLWDWEGALGNLEGALSATAFGSKAGRHAGLGEPHLGPKTVS